MSTTVNVGCKIPNGLQTQFVILNGSKPHSGIEAGYTSIDIETWLEMKRHYNNFISNGSIFADPKEESQAINSFHNLSIAEFKFLGITEVNSGLIAGHFGKGLKKKYAEEWLASEILPAQNPVSNQTSDKSTLGHDWHEMPFGKIAIGVATTIIGACVLYLIATYFGVKLN